MLTIIHILKNFDIKVQHAYYNSYFKKIKTEC